MYKMYNESLSRQLRDFFFVFQPEDFEKAAIQPPGELFLLAVVFLRGDWCELSWDSH